MKSITILAHLLVLVSGISIARNDKNLEVEPVKKVVQKAIDANYNNGNIELMKKYYHSRFNLLIVHNNELHYISLKKMIKGVSKKKAKEEYPPKEKISIEFLSVEVAGNAATVKFDYFKGKRRTCIDFISLYKFKEGWKIVSQTTYHYPEK